MRAYARVCVSLQLKWTLSHVTCSFQLDYIRKGLLIEMICVLIMSEYSRVLISLFDSDSKIKVTGILEIEIH